jgi:SAM-dependent methyltransferase
MLPFVSPRSGDVLEVDGQVLRSSSGEIFPISDGIPRFVASDGYAAAFGLEWCSHPTIQLDSRTRSPLTRQRLERCLGQPVEFLAGKTVLECGCGAGRFTEVLVAAGACVHALDLSRAVDANRQNIGAPANYVIAQADLMRPPFPAEAFDVVFCLGVLQHTPSPESSVRALYRMVKPGGMLVVDHYTWELSIMTKLAPVYRVVVRRLPPPVAKRLTDTMVRLFFPLHWAVRRQRLAQMMLSRVSPCQVYFRVYPHLTRAQHYEWCRLDTFDQLADRYKRLRTARQVRGMLALVGAEDIHVHRGGNGIEARGRKPLGPERSRLDRPAHHQSS